MSTVHFSKWSKEFEGASHPKRIRQAVRLTVETHPEAALKVLEKWLGEYCCKHGVTVEEVTATLKTFDWENKMGVAIAAHLKPADKAFFLYMASRYEFLCGEQKDELDGYEGLLKTLLKKRKAHTMKKAIREYLEEA